ncbi:MAG: PorV/PorQ family protein [candidate division Zixibacteria bacterium]|nr:PorV/PorQ family protein [candidate division Zixibacteria bacterium]
MRRTLLTFLGLFVVAAAIVPVQAGDAGQETPFILGAGASSLGMGGGYTALANDAAAVYYNPAGLTRLDYQELSLMHTVMFEGTLYNFGSWVYPISDKSGVGLGYMRVGTDDIVRTIDFEEQYTFGYSHSQFILAYGHRLFKGLSIGASLKVVNQSLDDNSVYGVGADIALDWRLYKHLSLGFIARDIIPAQLELKGYTETTPNSFTGGLAVRDIDFIGQTRLTASLDLEKHEQRDVKIHVGARLAFYDSYILRAGYDRDNLSFGAGLKLHRFKFDYAYKVMDYIEDSHNFSLAVLIGSSTAERMEKKRRLYAPEPVKEVVVDERQREFMRLKTKADYFFRQFQLDSALTYYHQSLEYDSDNQEVLETIASIEQARRLEMEQQNLLRTANREREQFIDRYYSQAVQFYEKKYYAAARDILELIFEIEPDNTRAEKLRKDIDNAISSEIEINWTTARQAQAEGRLVQAIEAYNRILDLEPDNVEARQARERALTSLNLSEQLNLGISLFKQGKYDAARSRFETVLKIDSHEPVALEYMEKIKEAHTKPSTLEDLQKDKNIWNLYLEGIRHMRNKDYRKAIDAWEKVLEVYPGNVNTLHNIEQARLRLESEKTE